MAKFSALQQTHSVGYVCVLNFVSIGLFCRPVAAKDHNFCRLFGLRHLGVKLNSYTTNLPLSNGIKIVSVLQRIHGEMGRNGAHKL